MVNLNELNQFKENVKYFLNSKWFIIPLLLVTSMSFGFTLTHPTVSVDDMAMDYYYRQNELLIQGRFFQVLIDKVLGIYNFRPFVLDFLAILCLIAAAVLWCALFKKVTNNQLKPMVYLVFACFFVSYPLITEIFIYMGSDFETGLGHLMIPFILFIMDALLSNTNNLKKPSIYMVPAFLIALTLSLYESFAVVYLFGIFAVLILRFLYSDVSRNIREVFKHGVYFVIPLISGIALRLVIDMILKLVLHLGSSTNASKEIHWDRGIVENLPKLVDGVVLTYVYNALVYLPITFLLLAISATVFLTVRDGIKHRSFTIVVLYLASIVSIFSLTILQGVETPYRACTVFSVFIAFVFMLVLQVVEESKVGIVVKKAVVVVFGIMIIWQINDINQWFYVDYLRYEEEVNVVNQVAAEIRSNYDLDKPVVFLGDYKLSDNINQYTSAEKTSLAGKLYMNLTGAEPAGKYAYKFVQSNGDSFLDWAVGWNFENNVSEAHKFFKFLGYDFKADNYELREEALKLAEDKPAWPKKGAIFETDEFIVVNFGITEKFANQVKLN
ncbi:glucosyltransferase domain-containing protein [Acetobacterium wieringae]|uniref:glucosyltransferase domain-containing protein n=1 Tax=Acetobacterium wieringae TaxID=52694 RepID=UPI0026F101FE|nr:glucosyltransferase domain-containing protein [Acetobacterium wieringae]